MLGYGSLAAHGRPISRGLHAKALVVGLMGVAAVAMVAVVTLGGGAGPSALAFGMSDSELALASDPLQASVAFASTGDAQDYASAARKALLAASYDNSVMDQARRHEADANAVVKQDEAQLSSLSLFDTADTAGIHTGHLPALEGITGPMGRYSLDADTTASNVAGGMLSLATDTQLSGLQDELNTLNGKKQSILDSLTLQRQATGVKAAHDAYYADTVRLHRAVATASTRALRDAMRAAQIAQRRAKEASIIEQNEQAIAKIAAQRAARLGAYREKALHGALQAESDLRTHTAAINAERDIRYHKAMGSYTQQLQSWVAQDMSTLGKLKVAEENAAFGPRLHGAPWRQYPVGDLPDIDPAYFMGDAPYRNATTLADFKAVDGATQLSQQGGVPAGGDGDSIVSVMQRADEEIAALQSRQRTSKGGQARLRAVHSKVDAQLQQLQAVAAKVGVEDGAPGWAEVAKPHALVKPHKVLAAAKKGAFTSFPKASLKSVQESAGDATSLDDGALIRHAKAPVANIAIPLGGHQDASRGHSAVKAPRPTIVDTSTEAQAVRADGSHNTLGRQARKAPPPKARMPHIA